jgi:uncharacterized protein (TIGR00645 family)
LKKQFEHLLVGMRWLMIVPVVALLVGAGYFAFLSVYDVIVGITRKDTSDGISEVLQAVDAALLCAIFIIVALGLYELFVGRLERADDKPLASALEVGDLDGLKDKLGKAILLVLIIRFFDFVASIELKAAPDLLMYAGGVALLALAIFLSRGSEPKKEPEEEERIGD